VTALVLPIRGFDGKTRLADSLDAGARRSALQSMARRAVLAGIDAGLEVSVVSPAREVRDWADSLGASTIEDPDTGLDDACHLAVRRIGSRPWIIAHADLPLVTSSALRTVEARQVLGTVLVPSRDGGTGVIAHRGAFPFSYGRGSFHRHLAAVPHATVLPMPELSIDLDNPLDLATLTQLGHRPTLGQ
jgi:2-phospho-L-lactate guanylyltransferase